MQNNTFNGCTGLTAIEIPDSIVSMQSTELTGCTNLKTVRVNTEVTNNVTISGMNKVYFMDDDEATFFHAWYVKSGVSMVGKEQVPVKANYTFSKWTKYTQTSVSTLGNIQDNITFMGVFNSTPGTAGPGQTNAATLTPSKTNPSNRETGVTVKIS